MKKYFIFGLMVAIVPNLCLGASTRYTQLVREKQRKMEELEKCMGATKGLKIAGVSTLGLTAVGVAGNIAEAKKRNEYQADIDSVPTKMANVQKEIDETNNEINKLEKKKLQQQESKQIVSENSFSINCRISGGTPINNDNCLCKIGNPDSTGTCVANGNTLRQVVEKDIEKIENTLVKLGAKIYTSGYDIDQLPQDLYDKIYAAMNNFTEKCDEIDSLFGDYPDSGAWGSNYTNVEKLNQNYVWTGSGQRVLAECVCNRGYKQQGNECVNQ